MSTTLHMDVVLNDDQVKKLEIIRRFYMEDEQYGITNATSLESLYQKMADDGISHLIAWLIKNGLCEEYIK